jgi:hypothetical protein
MEGITVKKRDEATRWQAVAFGVAAGFLAFFAMSMPIIDFAPQNMGLDALFQTSPESYSLFSMIPAIPYFEWKWLSIIFPLLMLLLTWMYAADETGGVEPTETFRVLLTYSTAISLIGFVIVPFIAIFTSGNPEVTFVTAPYVFRGALMFLALFIVSVQALQCIKKSK